jgi:diguanylate cyclase (GGDEF)-like protein/PAS domain S-box-containing protein
LDGVGNVAVSLSHAQPPKSTDDALPPGWNAPDAYRALVEQIPVVTYVQTPGSTSQTRFISPQVEQLTGYPPSAFIGDGANWISVTHPDDRAKLQAEVARTDASGAPFFIEQRIVHRDGSVRWVRNEAILTRHPDGSPWQWQGFMVDITEQKRIELQFRTLVDHLPAVTYVTELVDPSGVAGSGLATFISPQVEAVFGYTVAEWLVAPELWEERLHPDDRARVLAANAQANITGATNRIEYRWLAKDERVVWVLDESALVRDAGGAPLFWQGVMFDLTARYAADAARREAERRYRTLVEHIPAAAYAHELRDVPIFTYIGPQIERISGYPPAHFLGPLDNLYAAMHPDDRDAVRAEAERTDQTGEPFDVEHRFVRPDGSAVWVRNEAVRVRADDDGVQRWQGVITDITDRKRLEQQYRTLVEQIPAATYTHVVRETGEVVYMSPQIERISGYPPEFHLGALTQTLSAIHPDDRERVRLEAERTDSSHEPYRIEYRYLWPDGRTVWVRNEAVLVRVDDDGAEYWQGVISDVTERRKLEDALEHQAYHDALTGLPNRALLLDRVSGALARARRDGRQVAVAFLDLDNFKVVNDSLGHVRGDALLVRIARVLQASVRESDTVARFGGDEFVLLLDGVADAADAELVIARVQQALASPLKVGRARLNASASIGVAVSTGAQTTPELLLRDADIAMYRAKATGKQRNVVFTPDMRRAAVQRWQLETELRRGVARDEFTLHYQPTLELASGRIVGVEALARWQHATRGLLPPAEFIALAEETDLIVPLGRWALRAACQQARAWNAARAADDQLAVSVNLSARQFREPSLAHDIEAALDASGLAPELLTVEITETAAMDDVEVTAATLAALKRVGVSISIDDFGTGYSSLAYLRRFPVDSLKIDRSFIAGLSDADGERAIVSAIIELGHALGIRVVGEGVETAAQLACLRELGCDLAQGFLFAPPLPADAALERIAAGVSL